MEVSLSSFIICSLSTGLFAVILYLILKNDKYLSQTGILSTWLFALFIIFRGCLPFQLNFSSLSSTYLSSEVIPFLNSYAVIPFVSTRFCTLSLRTVLVLLWIAGFLVFTIKRSLSYLICRRKLRKMAYTPSADLEMIFQSASYAVLHKKINCRILVTNLVTVPAVFGICRYTILLPDLSYSESELYYIFCHELTHIHFRDSVAKLLCSLCGSIFWWNPLVSRLLPALLQQIQELHVDHMMCRTLSKKEKFPYLDCLGKSLVHTTSRQNIKLPLAHTLCQNTSERQFVQRLSFIMHTPKKSSSLLFLLIVLLLLFVSMIFSFEGLYISRVV